MGLAGLVAQTLLSGLAGADTLVCRAETRLGARAGGPPMLMKTPEKADVWLFRGRLQRSKERFQVIPL
jgi:hypothetical protein